MRIELHLTEEEVKKIDSLAALDNRSRKNFLETVIRNTINNKLLSEVTEEDAIEIIKARYPLFFINGKWTLEVLDYGVCKRLHGKYKAYEFLFYDDRIDIEPSPDCNYDVHFKCYLKAQELGYGF